MNSNSLFQSIQVLEHNIANYTFTLQQNPSDDDLLSKLISIMNQEKLLFYELERQVSSKVDRIEFSQIIQQKANQADVQKVLFEVLSCNNLNASQKLQNFLVDSINHEESCEQASIQHPQQQQHYHRKNDSSVPYSFNNTISDNSPINVLRQQCNMCFDDGKIGQRNQPQLYLRQAFSSLSDTINQAQNKENAIAVGGGILNSTQNLDLVKLSQKIDDIYQSLCSCIQTHCASKDEISQMHQQIEQKLNKEDLDVLLLQKANKQSVANALQRKANKSDIQQLEKTIADLDIHQQFQIKYDELRDYMDRTKSQYVDMMQKEILNSREETERTIKKHLGKDLSKINNEITNIQTSLSKYSQQLKDMQDQKSLKSDDTFQQFHQKLDCLQDQLAQESFNVRKLVKDQMFTQTIEIEKNVNDQIEHMQKIIKKDMKEVMNMVEMEKKVQHVYEAKMEQMEKMQKKECEKMSAELNKLSKDMYYEFDMIDKEFQKLRLSTSTPQTQSSPSYNDLEGLRLDVREVKLKLEKLNDEIAQKSNIKDVCVLIDHKANIEDVDKSMEDLYKDLQCNYAPKNTMEVMLSEQKFINDSLCALNCLGKWVWFGGFTSGSCVRYNSTMKANFKMSAFERVSLCDGSGMNGNVDYVKWSKEVINTCPDNFELSKFEDDAGAIQIKTSGIYEVLFVFFVAHETAKPSAQLRINGKPVLSTIDTQQHIIYHQDESRHVALTTFLHISAGQKLGICLSNSSSYLNSTTQSLLNMDYTFSSEQAKGFVSLRKL